MVEKYMNPYEIKNSAQFYLDWNKTHLNDILTEMRQDESKLCKTKIGGQTIIVKPLLINCQRRSQLILLLGIKSRRKSNKIVQKVNSFWQ